MLFICRVIVILETKVYVYNFQNLKLIEVIETAHNPSGIIAVNASKDTCIIAVPYKSPSQESDPTVVGEGIIRISKFPTNPGSNNNEVIHFNIPAHSGKLQAIALNKDGTLLATSSDKVIVMDNVIGHFDQDIQHWRG